ncbi:hypothetical protein [Gracilimonas amylolytica]|uniref:hypothetical protein n=1 Tax=Gracilimonas amylolytica TaxID=1749045 RepID=UPI000CD95EC4|nr:hypothetical protein [Gracilimonas amylolytica]
MNIRSLIVSIGILILSQNVWAQQGSFDQANTLLENGSPMEAMSAYRNVESSGSVSGALYLNMGITAMQLDSLGLSKFYFLKAKEYSTTQQQATEALEYVNSQFSRQSAILPKLPWDRAIDWINNQLSAFGLFLIGFLLTLSGLSLLYLGWLDKVPLSKTFSTQLTLIIIGSSLALLAFYADYVNQRYDEAVLISSSQRVLESPDENSALVSIAYEGYDLTVDQWESEQAEEWVYVRLGNGQYGWTKPAGIKTL